MKSYPKAVRIRVGCKVGWRYYSDRQTADQCAKAARYNAGIKAEEGYDFGYCAPGSVRETDDGLFEVCVP